MAYRGEDLDLRTPQGWTAGRDSGPGGEQPNWFTRSTIYKGGRSDPLWVDDNVMACCNHAYDLAVAHRAPEVRLEHLLNALTLNDAAAQIMETRGIGVASLRRESGASVANEIPAGPGNGQVNPRRSEAVDETLRLAADRAYPRRTPVTVEDLLHVLFDMKRDLPGLQLLYRNAATWTPRNGGADPRSDLRLEPLPHLARGYSTDPRYATPIEPRPRYASQAAHDYFRDPAQQTAPAYRDAPREPARTSREPAGGMVDNVQNNRIDALERAVRDLGLDLADERKSLQTIVGDMQRNAVSQIDDTQRFRGGLTDRLNALEDNLLRARADGGAIPAVLVDRIGSIERSLETTLGDVGRSWSSLGERLQALELASRRQGEIALPPLLAQKLDSLSGVSTKLDAVERTFQLILDRLTGLERKLAATTEAMPVDLAPIEARLANFERTIVTNIQQGGELAPITDLLSGIESRVAGLERSIENRAAETGRTVSFIGERLRTFEEAIAGPKGPNGERLAQIEKALEAYAERTVETSAAHNRDLTELHEVLLKLNANQQTLAGSLDQWRLDSTGDLSVVSNRLKAIEELGQQPNAVVEELNAKIAAMHAVQAKRAVNKSRFRNWLFGTEEWYSASYDTETWRARQAAEFTRGIEQRQALQQQTMQQQVRATPPASPPSALRR